MMERLSDSDFKEKCGYFDSNFADIKSRIIEAAKVSGRTAEDIILLAASKTVAPEVINYAIENGIDYIGENRVQEFLSKESELLPCHRHFIGHLQTNKVKSIIGRVEMIQSVHSEKLAKEISKQSTSLGITTDILLEVNIGEEESKSGFSATEITEAAKKIAELPGISVKGLMSIPPICEEKDEIRKYFQKMNTLFVDIGTKNIYNCSMKYLSMGMSQDFDVAIECGANIVRIGTSLFGKRNYNINKGE